MADCLRSVGVDPGRREKHYHARKESCELRSEFDGKGKSARFGPGRAEIEIGDQDFREGAGWLPPLLDIMASLPPQLSGL